MFKIALIAAGGGLGALLRYAAVGWGQRLGDGVFPTGTLLVNVTGCIVVGILSAVLVGPHAIREEYRLALGVGLLGAFTTFSAFGWETIALVKAGHVGFAVANVALNNTLGLAGAWVGYTVGLRWVGIAAP